MHRNIDQRVEQMLKQGLVEEVKGLQAYRHLNALQTVGYTELFSYLDGSGSLEEATALIKKNTRLYAKRQYTWFRRDAAVNWFPPTAVKEIIEYCKSGFPSTGCG